MTISNHITRGLCGAACIFLTTLPAAALADSGFYVGGSYGNASVDVGLDVPGFSSGFDEDDSAYKVLLGYRFDLPSVFLGVEGGYVDLGEPELTVATERRTIDSTGVNLWGIAGLEAGPAEFFAKVGYIAWDAERTLTDELGDRPLGSDDGSDMGYGLGIAFGLGPVSVRGEFEKYDMKYDIGDADVSMISIGVTYLFD